MKKSTVADNQEKKTKKKRSVLKEKAKASETRYRRLFESAKDGILILDAETGKIIDVNPFLMELLGYSKEEFVEKSIWEIGAFQDVFENKEKFLELQNEEYVRYDDLPLVTSDGREIHVEFISNVYFVNKKKVIQCNIRDITERKEADVVLENTRIELAEIKEFTDEINELTENVIDTVREPLLALDKDLRVIKASRSFYKFFKVTAKETIGKLIYELGNHQWDIPKLRELLEKIIPKKNPFDNYEVEHNFATIGKRVMLLNARQVKRAFGKEKVILLAIEDITDRKAKEDSLKEINRATSVSLNTLLDHLHSPIIIWDASMIIKRFNRKFEQLSGYDSAEAIDKKIDFLFPKEKIAATLDLLKNHLADEEEVVEIDILTKDNHIKTVLWTSSRIFDEDGKDIIATISQDITNRRQSELALQKSESQLRTLVKTIPDLIWLKDTNGLYLSCNAMFERFFGAKESDIIGKTDYDFVDHELADLFRENDRKAIEAGKPTSNEEWVTFADDGHRAFLETTKSPIYDAAGALLGVMGIGRDNTERKHAGQVLQASEERFRAIFDQAPIAFAMLDMQGHPILSNVRFSKMLGYSKDELAKMMFTEFTYPEDIDKDLNQFNDLKDGKISRYSMEKRYIHKNGNLIWANLFVTALNDSNGVPQEIIGMVEDITEQKKFHNEIKFQADLINNVGQSVIATDLLGKVIYWNNAAEKIYGWSNAEAIGESILDLTPAQQSNEQAIDLMQKLSAGKSWAGEFQVKRKDGSSFTAFVTDTPILDANGELTGIIGISSDITERKNTEKALQESELQFRNLYDNAKIGLYRSTPDGTILMANKLLIKMIGYQSFDELAERNLEEDVFDPSYNREAFLKKIEKDGEVNDLESAWKRKDGSLFYVRENSRAIRNSEGKTIYYDGVVEDITQQKMAEKEITMLSQSLKSINECVSITDLEDKIVFVNQAFSDTYGYELKELIGKSISLIRSPKNKENLIGEILPSTITGEWRGELTNKRKNGGEFPVYLSTSVIKDKDNKTLGLIGVATDITERKRVETELIEAKDRAEESDRLKTAFLANMSHEIRTPMNGILGFTELLKDHGLSGDDQQEYIEIIEISGARMLNIINDIVSISKIESGQIEITLSEVDINKQIEDIYNFFSLEAENKKLSISFKNGLPANEAIIKTDSTKVYAVLTNLVKNAIKFTKKGSIELGYLKKDGFLEFFVRDSGLGVRAEQKDMIFERFRQGSESYTRDYEGAGLGLSISKAYVEMLGGKIWVENNESNNGDAPGATFYFTLPANYIKQSKNITQHVQPVETTKNEFRKLNVLIVEDDKNSELLISKMVEGFAGNVLTATTGIEAIEVCLRNPDIDLVLMDINMPQMNGYEATRKIRKFNKEVVIIAQTAYALTGDREKSLAVGCNDYITKPIRRLALVNIVNKYFSASAKA